MRLTWRLSYVASPIPSPQRGVPRRQSRQRSKFTAPRSAPGKQRSAANALRIGRRASSAFWPRVHVITRVTSTGHPLFNRDREGVLLSLKPGAKAR